MEMENQLRRAGKIAKDKKEIVVLETKLELQSKEVGIMEPQKIEGVLVCRTSSTWELGILREDHFLAERHHT